MGKYNLYVEKNNCEIKIINVTNRGRVLSTTYQDEPKIFNNNYYVGSNRNKLKDLALKIKESWEKDAEKKLEKIRNIKI